MYFRLTFCEPLYLLVLYLEWWWRVVVGLAYRWWRGALSKVFTAFVMHKAGYTQQKREPSASHYGWLGSSFLSLFLWKSSVTTFWQELVTFFSTFHCSHRCPQVLIEEAKSMYTCIFWFVYYTLMHIFHFFKKWPFKKWFWIFEILNNHSVNLENRKKKEFGH